MKGTGNGMPDQNGPISGGGKDTGKDRTGVPPELVSRQCKKLQKFRKLLLQKHTPPALRTLLIELLTMQLRGGYTQQEPAKRFAPPYRTPAATPPSYHKIDDQGGLTVDRRRVSEDMTGGRRGTTVPPESLVRSCAQVYCERTRTDVQTMLPGLLQLREEAVREVRHIEQQRRDQAHSSGLRGPDSKRVRELREENDQLLSELAGLREHRAEQERTIDRLNEEIADQGAHLEQMRADNIDLQARLAELSATLASMTYTGQQQTNQISDLHTELARVRDDLAAKEQKISELTTERDRLHRQSTRLRGEIDRLQARLVELDADAIDEVFQEIAEHSGLQSPLEHALVGGANVRQYTDTDNPRGHIDRAGQQLPEPPPEPPNDPAATTKTTTGIPQHAGASSLRQLVRVHRLLAALFVVVLSVVAVNFIPPATPTLPSTTAHPEQTCTDTELQQTMQAMWKNWTDQQYSHAPNQTP